MHKSAQPKNVARSAMYSERFIIDYLEKFIVQCILCIDNYIQYAVRTYLAKYVCNESCL